MFRYSYSTYNTWDCHQWTKRFDLCKTVVAIPHALANMRYQILQMFFHTWLGYILCILQGETWVLCMLIFLTCCLSETTLTKKILITKSYILVICRAWVRDNLNHTSCPSSVDWLANLLGHNVTISMTTETLLRKAMRCGWKCLKQEMLTCCFYSQEYTVSSSTQIKSSQFF